MTQTACMNPYPVTLASNQVVPPNAAAAAAAAATTAPYFAWGPATGATPYPAVPPFSTRYYPGQLKLRTPMEAEVGSLVRLDPEYLSSSLWEVWPPTPAV